MTNRAPRDAAQRNELQLAREYAPVALALVFGLGLSLGLQWLMRQQVQAVARYDFSEEAKSSVSAIARAVEAQIDKVRWLGATLTATPDLSHAAFQDLAGALFSESPPTVLLQWSPRVPVDRRADFEATARAAGLEGYTIHGLAPSGDATATAGLDACYPVLYVQDTGPSGATPGFDLASDPVLWRYLNLAAEKGAMFFVSEAPSLATFSTGRTVMAVCPVYETGVLPATPEGRVEALRGFASGLLLVEPLVDTALNTLTPLEIDVHAFDFFGAPGKKALLYRPGASQSREAPYVFEDTVQMLPALNYVGALSLGETRRWLVACTPSPDFAFGIESWSPFLGLGIGLAFTFVVAYHFHAIIRQRRAAERLVVRRTAELERSNRRLGHEVAERRRFELERDDLMALLEASNTSLHQLNARLERSNRDLQDFALVASHDLKEPLRKVRVLAQSLRDKLDSTPVEGAQEYLELMDGALRRMHDLITSLLRLSRVSTHGQPFEKVNLGRVLSEVISDLAVRIEETGGAIDVGEFPTIEADPMQMRQIVQNILENSLKYHRDGVPPRIQIRAQTTPANGAAGTCTLVFEDNGIGFAPELSERAFTLFQRLENGARVEGSGVGLAVCRKIAERHGGTIRVRSEAGKGSTFIVTLPLTHDHGY